MTEDLVAKTLQQYKGTELVIVQRTLEVVSRLAPEALERTAQLAGTYKTKVLDEITQEERVRAYWLYKQDQQRGATVDYNKLSKAHGTRITINWPEERREFEQRVADGYVLPDEKIVLESASKKRANILGPIMGGIEETASETEDGVLVTTVAETLAHERVLRFLTAYSGVLTSKMTSLLPVLAQSGSERVLSFLDDYVRRVEEKLKDI